jgi:hypothetical protein
MFDRLKNFRASKEFQTAAIALSENQQPSPSKSFETRLIPSKTLASRYNQRN